ncbi:MAG: hypothetical protein ACJA16_004367 [Akkermansiaceae bacterium]|jgi:hypothetical protein
MALLKINVFPLKPLAFANDAFNFAWAHSREGPKGQEHDLFAHIRL